MTEPRRTQFQHSDYNALSDDAFRDLVRGFLRERYPEHLRFPAKRLRWDEVKPWYMILAEAGWLAPSWPREHGGMELSPFKHLIYVEEFESYGAARMPDHGIIMLGPLLIRFGNEAQRNRFLPRILDGSDIWCQGYSEPNAGSDLASVRTEAVLDGDEWVVNGQKIWTTLASDANWMFALVRTDKQAKKQNGISFLLIPMDSPGITLRPIVNIDLQDEFYEVFFDNVRVPRENIVGEINQGWSMAKALLGFERIFLGTPRQASNALAQVSRLAAHYDLLDDPHFADRFTELRIDLADHECLFAQVAEKLRKGEMVGAEASLLKLNQTQLFQRITELGLELSGQDGARLDPAADTPDLHPAGQFLAARAATIYGGTSEVQRNIIAKTMLELG